MGFLDLTKIFRKYKEKWVAYGANDTIIASDVKLDKVYKKAEKKGYKNPFVAKIPDPDTNYLL